VDPRAQELSEALIDICSSTAAGSKASATTKQEIQELVRGQQQYCNNKTKRSLSATTCVSAAFRETAQLNSVQQSLLEAAACVNQ
jgi:hypothetical protein